MDQSHESSEDVKAEIKEIHHKLNTLIIGSEVTKTQLENVLTKVNDHLHEHRTLRIATYSALMSVIVGLIIVVTRFWLGT